MTDSRETSDDLRASLEAAAASPRARPTEQTRSSGAKSRVHDETQQVLEREPLDHWSPPTAMSLPPSDSSFVYRWITEYVNGAAVTKRVQDAIREGYRPVHIADLPEGFIVDEDTKGDGIARMGGLIMMKLPRKFAEQRRAYYERRTAESLSGADELQGIAGRDYTREDRGTRSLDGQAAGNALRNMART